MKYAVCLPISGMLQLRGSDAVLDAVPAASAADQRLRLTVSLNLLEVRYVYRMYQETAGSHGSETTSDP
jgi:hypothetical protein